MEDAEWKEFVNGLVEARRCLRHSWEILDGTDGAAAESEQAVEAALAAIDEIYRVEAGHEANQDVASPIEVQKFWDARGQLPGFGVGT